MSAHAKLISRSDVKLGSNRVFGLFFTVVFIAIGLWPLIDHSPVKVWSLFIAFLLLLISILKPNLLKPITLKLVEVGRLLNILTSLVVMGLLFYVTITPIAFLIRFFGKRPLCLEFDKIAESYWIQRIPPGPKPDNMKTQY